MDAEERRELIQTWIAHHKKLAETRKIDDATFWSYEKLDDLCQNSPDLAWEVIQEILEADQSDAVVANLAAGPLEDLLAEHGLKFINRVEERARQNPMFRHLLGGVWQNAMSNEIWARVQAAAGERW